MCQDCNPYCSFSFFSMNDHNTFLSLHPGNATSTSLSSLSYACETKGSGLNCGGFKDIDGEYDDDAQLVSLSS